MAWFDIIVVVLLFIALMRGYVRGLLVEVCGLAALFISAYLAYRFVDAIIRFFNIDSRYDVQIAFVIGFLIAFALILVASRLITKFIDSAGLGALNKWLGAVVGCFKYAVIIAALFALFNSINKDTGWVGQKKLDESYFYRPFVNFAGIMFPYIADMKETLVESEPYKKIMGEEEK